MFFQFSSIGTLFSLQNLSRNTTLCRYNTNSPPAVTIFYKKRFITIKKTHVSPFAGDTCALAELSLALRNLGDIFLCRRRRSPIIANDFGYGTDKADVIDPEVAHCRIIGGCGNRQRDCFADRTSQIDGKGLPCVYCLSSTQLHIAIRHSHTINRDLGGIIAIPTCFTRCQHVVHAQIWSVCLDANCLAES